jgi:hypothetical protein
MGMTKREKVIKGLEKCRRYECDDCTEKCASQFPGDCTAYDDFVDSALALLKAQEPRVMTLGEIDNALKMPLWKETKRAHKDLYTGWVLAYDIQKGLGITGTRLGMSEPSGRVVWYGLDDYGKTWRCWTSRPTDEQRESVKWD